MANNFYEWLELSVEHFESDPAKLAPILEKNYGMEFKQIYSAPKSRCD